MIDGIKNSTIIGFRVPVDRSNCIRIGHGNVYLQIADGKAEIIGAETSEAVEAVLDGVLYGLRSAALRASYQDC